MSETIQVYWGNRWIIPKSFRVKDDRTVIALVETRADGWQNVKFHNRVFGDKSWRRVSIDPLPEKCFICDDGESLVEGLVCSECGSSGKDKLPIHLATVEVDIDISAYEKQRQELEQKHMGKWVLFHDQKLVAIHDSFEAAADEAVRLFGRGPYLIRQIGAPPVILPASVMYRLHGSLKWPP